MAGGVAQGVGLEFKPQHCKKCVYMYMYVNIYVYIHI
jgi:hypothetical protein